MLGPAARVISDEHCALQEVGRATLDAGDLLVGDVSLVGLEYARLRLRVDGDLLELVVEHTNKSRVPANPQASS